jgi:thiosulfate/3-mercaptopyruvate sulfurtransferase
VGPEEEFAKEHIPGARYVTHGHRQGKDGLVLELPPVDEFEAQLEALGVSDDSKIVVYWGGEWVTPTTRLVFELDWAGLGAQTVLLDGGIEAWKEAGGQVTGESPSVATGSLTLRPRAELVVDADFVQSLAHREHSALVDGRARAYYDGVRKDREREGHIPGALSIPWTELVNESVRFRSAEELGAIFAKAGVKPDDTVVVYCHIGQYATAVIFAARTLGHDVMLYDGAFQDWARLDLPVETESK